MKAVLRGLLAAASVAVVNAKKTVLVTGATGKTGVLTYRRLKAEGEYDVRAFIRNTTKARDVLGCDKCDESEGFFVGDIRDQKLLTHAMDGVDTLVVVTASVASCHGIFPLPFGKCSYQKGLEPKVMDWQVTMQQVKTLASAPGALKSKHILLVSAALTESPDNFLDKVANGQNVFYKLNAEADIMSSGLPFTIVKACGLGDGPGGKKKLLVGHDGNGFNLAIDHQMSRDDVARVLVEAINSPEASKNTRFDICAHFMGAPTTDILNDVIKASYFKWDARARADSQLIV